MKIAIGSILITALTLLSSCKKLKKIVQFNLEYKTEIVVPSTVGAQLPFNVFTPDVTTNSEASFEANDTRKDLINEIILTQLQLTVKSPNGEDFSFLKSAEVFINADGLDEKSVALISEVPDPVGNQIDLTPSGSDLAPYIKSDEFSLKVRTVTDEALASDHTIEVKSKFRVEGKLINSD